MLGYLQDKKQLTTITSNINLAETLSAEIIPNDLIEDEDGDIDEVIKAISDIDTTPTDSMVIEAKKGIAWRKEFNRGGTRIGAVRASQIIAKEKLSPSTVKRMFSFFSRHEVDKQADGFNVGEKGYPSNGRIAWALWGGDAGFSWSTKVRNQLEKEKEKFLEDGIEEKQVTEAVKEGLKNKKIFEKFSIILDECIFNLLVRIPRLRYLCMLSLKLSTHFVVI